MHIDAQTWRDHVRENRQRRSCRLDESQKDGRVLNGGWLSAAQILTLHGVSGEPLYKHFWSTICIGKCMANIEKRNFLFRYVMSPMRCQLKFDDEALWSTTDQVTADKITRDLGRIFSRDTVITDGTACVGGNTYSFAQHFAHVRAYELAPIRADYLVHNLHVLGVDNCTVRCGDVLELVARDGNHDLLFLDPPWGGPEYKNEDNVYLYLSGVSISDVCRRLRGHVRAFALKVPTNFDEARFLAETADFLEPLHRNTQLRKMHLLVMRCRATRECG
jgi:RNA cap guanine-N2 methyltransferase